MSIRIFIHLAFLFLAVPTIVAQPPEQAIKIVVSPDHADWEYKIGEECIFTVVVYKDQVPVSGVNVSFQYGPERMKPVFQDKQIIKEGSLRINSGSMQQPGFWRCIVSTEINGKQYRQVATVAYAASAIRPTVTEPANFDGFWVKARQELDQIPLDAKMALLPEKSSALTNVYHVNVQSWGGSRLYGILCVPKKEGKYPAILQVPGAGIRPYNPDLELADKGFIVFSIGIHGIPVTMDPSVYNDLNTGALKGYFFFNADNKDRFYYKRVYMGCVRSVDFIFSLPQFDGQRMAVSGNSQGGALSIITAALDKRIQYLAAVHPALCDLTGYFFNRAGGWPHYFAESNLWFSNTDQIKETLPYYDVVNFARRVKVSGFYTLGYNDDVCPPTSMFSAINVIKAPKEMALLKDSWHWMYPEQKQQMNQWLIQQLSAQ
jgi:cephalosporin-C deacetylase